MEINRRHYYGIGPGANPTFYAMGKGSSLG
jgi:hypothetical protein